MKVGIVCNPAAGLRACTDELVQVAEFLSSQGWDVASFETTHGPSDITTYTRRASRNGYDVVFLAGGDGSIAEAVDGLVHTDTALAVLPGGSGNVFARQLNLPVPGGWHPRPLLEAARLLVGGQVRRVDVGRMVARHSGSGPRHFLSWGGVGFDAQVNRMVSADPVRKRRLGAAATIISSFINVRDFAGTYARVRIDGHPINRRLIMLVANNIQLYGIIIRMAQHAVMDDGWLDIYAFQGTGPARTLLHALRLVLNRHIQDPEVDIFRARRIEISTSRPLPVHVDGDYIGHTPVVIEVVPKAMNLLVPLCAPASLFVDGSGMQRPPISAWEWVQRLVRDAQSAFRERSTPP